ncbi:helix-turn-helix domain-containing protein [Streptomyces sp. A13(2022)]|uniref:helix-turn-helix domain-containing protein n=1 Tax=Streptomyces sp. A13(2022) TaxID=2964768 RepID=UPI0021D9F106|nr:helix-turn-helix transcriptional regulator [Streptomyces sp. A13(2022)]MCU8589361.1 helix-turn-helix transcriptional regulator [Streptomyces sp. A13(2022)]
MDTIVLKVTAFEAVTNAQGHTTYEQQADATGLSAGVLHRLRNGGAAGPSAIARICTTYGAAFDEMFEFGTVAPTQHSPRAARRRVKAAAA